VIITIQALPIVLVTQRVDSLSGREEIRDAVDQKLLQWIVCAGFLPVTVPNILSLSKATQEPTLNNWLLTIQPRAIILSGGNDIGEYPERDTTELFLLSWAASNRIPLLGVCRGMQVMAVWGGVNLVKVTGHVRSRHQLKISKLSGEWPSGVNSFHNWALGSCPPDFDIVAKAEDESIEAIKHKNLPWEGWMWHPERETPFSPQDTERLKRLFNEK
jgi:gamma-glutamyl-gamma-aminobutyrate hydrolase PuuD